MYVIGRFNKLKSTHEMRAKLHHNTREHEVLNADPKLAHLNKISGTVAESVALYNAQLGSHKPRKNAVHGLEYLFSASPEWFSKAEKSQQNQYFNDCLNLVKEKYGAKNIVNVAIHFDESTPHMHVMLIPMHDKKLSAKHYLPNGPRDARAFQEALGKIGAKYGLKRGLAGSRAKHTAVKKVYTLVKNPEKILKIGLGQERAESINAKSLQVAAHARKEASKKAGKAKLHAASALKKLEQQEAKSNAAISSLKADISNAKASYSQELKALQKQLASTQNALNKAKKDAVLYKQRAKKAEENAEKNWKLKNAKYLDNLQKDRHANLTNMRKNSKKEEQLKAQEAHVSRLTEDLQEEIKAANIKPEKQTHILQQLNKNRQQQQNQETAETSAKQGLQPTEQPATAPQATQPAPKKRNKSTFKPS